MMSAKKSELDKLEEYLINHRITYERFDEQGLFAHNNRHQICVPEEGQECKWDAVCHYGSYGYEEGLLEIYGEIVDFQTDGDNVVGFLTAQDVIERIETKNDKDNYR